MNQKILSISIPTYNRGIFLKENILEIIRQAQENGLENKIEINISDNHSTDDTEKIIQEIITEYKEFSIAFSKNASNLGPDKNYILAMKMAQGKYSWLLGSDDMPESGSLKRFIEILSNDDSFDILLFNRNNYDLTMQNFAYEDYFLRKDIPTQIFDFSDKLQEKNYYNSCRTLGGIFSYISSIIYKTDIINRYTFDESFIGTAYAHTFYFFKCIKEGSKLRYIRDHLVKNRTGNDSFGSGYQRSMIDFNGYNFIRSKFFLHDDVEKDFLEVLKWEHPFHRLIYMCSTMSRMDWKNLTPLLKDCGWSDEEVFHIEQISNTPNMYQSRLKQQIKKLIGKN